MKETIDALCISTDFNEVRFTSDAVEAGSRNCYEEAETGATSIYTYNDRRVYLCYFYDSKCGISLTVLSPPSQPN